MHKQTKLLIHLPKIKEKKDDRKTDFYEEESTQIFLYLELFLLKLGINSRKHLKGPVLMLNSHPFLIEFTQ